jgi:hypothetical protein
VEGSGRGLHDLSKFVESLGTEVCFCECGDVGQTLQFWELRMVAVVVVIPVVFLSASRQMLG